MTRFCSILFLFLALVAVPTVASAALTPEDDPTIIEGLRDKGVDWLKDKAKDAGQSWIFDTDQSETMHEILLKSRERADGFGNDQAGLCRGAVMGKASSILNDINYKWTAKTAGKLAFDTVTKMAGLAAGFGGAAAEGDAINWLIDQYVDAAKDQAKDSVFDRIKKLFGEEKKPEFELYETSGKNGDCEYTLRAAWDIVHGTYRVYIAGDCHCQEVGNAGVMPRPLGQWWISFEGHLKLQVQGKTASWVVGEPRMDFDAQCACSKRKLREAFTQPAKEPPSTTGSGGSTQPAGPPPLPPARRKVCKECQKIQEEIDADLKALDEAVEQVDQLGVRYREAKAKLGQHEGSLDDPAAYGTTKEALQREIEKDKAIIKAIELESRRLEAEQIRLKAALRDLAKLLEDCIKAHCPDGHSSISKPTEEHYAVAPPPVRKCEEQQLSSLASTVLAVHNSERMEVGAQPLCWNSELAQHATEYAQELAHAGQLVHASREGRGIERENLSEGMPWWSLQQLMGNWTREKERFHPGTFPNVCKGDWSECAHYTQMIWALTTDIGCGEAAGSGHTWFVCRYSPGGNKDGKPVGTPEAAAEAYNSWIRARLVGGDYIGGNKSGKPVGVPAEATSQTTPAESIVPPPTMPLGGSSQTPTPPKYDIVKDLTPANLGECSLDFDLDENPQEESKPTTASKDIDAALFDMTLFPSSIDPSEFIDTLLGTDAKSGGTSPSFNDPAFNKKMDRAPLLSGPARFRAYGELDIDLMKNSSPWLPSRLIRSCTVPPR